MRFSNLPAAAPRRQSGAGLMLFLLILIVAVLTAVVARLPGERPIQRLQAENARALGQAREATLAWAVAHPTDPGRLPLPDRNADGNYDDTSDCVNGVLPNHLLGRLPIRGEFVPGGGTSCLPPEPALDYGPETTATDATGERLWYAVSRHVVHDVGISGSPTVVPSLYDTTTGWLRITDEDGNLIDDQVAFLLIAPGNALAGQNRAGAAPAASNYLDAVSAPGVGSNADTDLRFIRAAQLSTVPGADAFNDTLVYMNKTTLMVALVKRAAAEIDFSLKAYHAANGQFPFAAPATDGVCQPGTATGFLPVLPGGCGAALGGLPGWLTANWIPDLNYQRVNPNTAIVSVTQTMQSFTVVP